jgi:hypothetical protein
MTAFGVFFIFLFRTCSLGQAESAPLRQWIEAYAYLLAMVPLISNTSNGPLS